LSGRVHSFSGNTASHRKQKLSNNFMQTVATAASNSQIRVITLNLQPFNITK
jgi:hypothetical protein